MKSSSILRDLEHEQLSQLSLRGTVLDIGGSRKSRYQELIKGEPVFYVINIDDGAEPDELVDVEKEFPFTDNQFDHAICMNVIEHVFEFENVFKETMRSIKPGGCAVFAVPFMHHIHASPDDYLRYTESAYRRLAQKHGCNVEKIEGLGYGFFSLGYQCIGSSIPTNIGRTMTKRLSVSIDKILNRLSARYRKLTSCIPLGYFVVFMKPETHS
jgi:SAM-dependent methyltransferase